MDHIPREAWVEESLFMEKPVVLEPPLTAMLHSLPDNKVGVSQAIPTQCISRADCQEGKKAGIP